VYTDAIYGFRFNSAHHFISYPAVATLILSLPLTYNGSYLKTAGFCNVSMTPTDVAEPPRPGDASGIAIEVERADFDRHAIRLYPFNASGMAHWPHAASLQVEIFRLTTIASVMPLEAMWRPVRCAITLPTRASAKRHLKGSPWGCALAR
jgi:hypothetical protein